MLSSCLAAGLRPCGGCGGAPGGWHSLCWRWRPRDAVAADLRAQPAGRGRPVVLYGASDGAQAALLTASYLPHLADAVVANSPTDLIHGATSGTGPGWTFGGKPLEAGMLIPVTRIRVPLLIGDGGQDAVWDSARVAW